MKVLWKNSDATVIEATANLVATEYPHSTRSSKPTCSHHISAALYETHVAGYGESVCVSSTYPNLPIVEKEMGNYSLDTHTQMILFYCKIWNC